MLLSLVTVCIGDAIRSSIAGDGVKTEYRSQYVNYGANDNLCNIIRILLIRVGFVQGGVPMCTSWTQVRVIVHRVDK